MEAAGKLVIDAATGHFFEGGFGHGEKMFFFRLLIALKDQVDSRRVRELRGAAEAAVLNVEKLCDGFDLRVDDAGVEISSRSEERRVGKECRVRGWKCAEKIESGSE